MQWLGILGSACAAAGALVPLDLVAPWLVPRVFGPGYAGVVPLLWILTPAGVFLACNQVTGDMLRGRKRPLVVARAEGLAAVFTVILLVALLPVAGVYGAAIASTVAYGVALVMMLRPCEDCRQTVPGPGTAGARLPKARPRECRDVRECKDDCHPPSRGDHDGPHLQGRRATFVEGNYLACDPEEAAELPSVTWSKSE